MLQWRPPYQRAIQYLIQNENEKSLAENQIDYVRSLENTIELEKQRYYNVMH